MKNLLICLPLAMMGSLAQGQACWSEWERDGEWLLRAGKCTENVSIPDAQKLCRSRVKSDVPRTAASCPASAKVHNKAEVYTAAVEFRCMGLKPPAAGGAANVFHYGVSRDPEAVATLRDLCTQFGGRWEPAR